MFTQPPARSRLLRPYFCRIMSVARPKYIVLWLGMLMLMAFQSMAQPPVIWSHSVYTGSFYNHARGWETGSGSGIFTNISGGHLLLQRQNPDARSAFLAPAKLPVATDFIIRLRAQTFSSGLWGILFWYQDQFNYQALMLDVTAQNIMLRRCSSGAITDTKVGVLPDSYISAPEHNTLELIWKSGILALRINERSALENLRLNAPELLRQPSRVGIYIGTPLLLGLKNFTLRLIDPAPAQSIAAMDTLKSRLWSKRPLRGKVNSPWFEHKPVIFGDGSLMYLVRMHPENMLGIMEEDIWFSKRGADSSWSIPFRLNSILNNVSNNAVISAIHGGRKLLLLGSYNFGNMMMPGSSFSIAESDDAGRWYPPQNVIIKGFYTDNIHLSAQIPENETVLITSAERSDGRGEEDLYVSFPEADGSYSVPRNLGPQINTPGKEIISYISPDTRTIYFSSDGHPGIGGTDLFVARRLDESWQRWTPPVNLSVAINTTKDDDGLVFDVSGRQAYMSSEISPGNEDIFEVSLPDTLRPALQMHLHFEISRCTDHHTLAGEITLRDTLSRETKVYTLYSDSTKSDVALMIPEAKAIRLTFKPADLSMQPIGDSLIILKSKSAEQLIRLCINRVKSPALETRPDTVPQPVIPDTLSTLPKPPLLHNDSASMARSDTLPMQANMTRQLVIQRSVRLSQSSVNIEIWDDGIEDGDRVMIRLNGKMIRRHIHLRKEHQQLELELPEGNSTLEMYAENVGRTPPNTASLRIISPELPGGGTTFRLRSDMHSTGAVEIRR